MKAFRFPKKPSPGIWFRVTLDVAVDAMRPSYDTDTDTIVKLPVRETRTVVKQVVGVDGESAGRIACEQYLSDGVRQFDRELTEVRLTAEAPVIKKIVRQSEYDGAVAEHREVLRAQGHQRPWPSAR